MNSLFSESLPLSVHAVPAAQHAFTRLGLARGRNQTPRPAVFHFSRTSIGLSL